MSDDTEPKGLTFTVRDGGAVKPEEKATEKEPETTTEREDSHAVTNAKSGHRRKS